MNIDKQEVLRYLGHRGQAYDERLEEQIQTAISTCQSLARPQITYRLFELNREQAGIRLAGTELILTGQSIAAHLQGAEQCALLAVTLGVEVENRIRVLERGDITASLVLDAAAADAVEKVCDEAEAAIAQEAETIGLYNGPRFSPGYGDLPLTLQPGIVRVLDTARRIGLTCTESLILLPRKSVTAIAGLFDQPQAAARSDCSACSLRERCDFRRCARGGIQNEEEKSE